jgi:hypothetical protein
LEDEKGDFLGREGLISRKKYSIRNTKKQFENPLFEEWRPLACYAV